MTLCEENCDLINYNYTTKKVLCSCKVKLEMTEIQDIKFNKNEFFKSFTDIKNMINFNVMKCYKAALNSKDLLKNSGFYLISLVILFFIITLIIFIFIAYNKLNMDIIKIIFALKATVVPQTVNDNKNILIVKSQRKTNKITNKKIDLKNEIEIKDINNINEKE